MEGGAWQAIVHGVAKSRTGLSDFTFTVIQVYAPTSNAEKAEVEWFYEDIQDLTSFGGIIELTPPKDVLFIIGDWNAKVGSQELPGVTPYLDKWIDHPGRK